MELFAVWRSSLPVSSRVFNSLAMLFEEMGDDLEDVSNVEIQIENYLSYILTKITRSTRGTRSTRSTRGTRTQGVQEVVEVVRVITDEEGMMVSNFPFYVDYLNKVSL